MFAHSEDLFVFFTSAIVEALVISRNRTQNCADRTRKLRLFVTRRFYLCGRSYARYEDARYLEAEVYFFRNFSFETSRGQPGRSPIFVARSLSAVVPQASPWPRRVMWMMLGATGLLVALVFIPAMVFIALSGDVFAKANSRMKAHDSAEVWRYTSNGKLMIVVSGIVILLVGFLQLFVV